MFEKFNKLKQIIEIGFSKTKLYITVDGKVLNRRYEPIPLELNKDGHEIITIESSLYPTTVFRVCDLVAIYFKWLSHLIFEILVDVEAFHLDGDITNNHASNIGFRFKNGPKESLTNKGYYYIPGYPFRVINKEGDIRNDKTGQSLKMNYTLPGKKNITGGYAVTTIQLNNQGDSIRLGRHRAMLLAFRYIPDNIESLVCNHINGIPGDDRLENLEWVTRKRNLAHAYETGLRSQNRPVLVKHVLTNEITEYFSVAEAARNIGVNDRGLNQMLEQRPFGSVNGKGYQIKYKDDERDWVILNDPKRAIELTIQKIGVKARNCSSLEVFEFESIGKASEYTGVKQATIGYRFSKEDYSPLRNWQFIPVDIDDFPDFTEEERLSTLGPINFKVIARNLNTSEIRNFNSVKQAGQSDIGIINISDRLRRGQQPVVDKLWQFKLDDGSDWQEPKPDWFAYSQPHAIYALDIETGNVFIHDTIGKLADALNVSKNVARRKCDTGELVENKYIFTRNNPAKL